MKSYKLDDFGVAHTARSLPGYAEIDEGTAGHAAESIFSRSSLKSIKALRERDSSRPISYLYYAPSEATQSIHV